MFRPSSKKELNIVFQQGIKKLFIQALMDKQTLLSGQLNLKANFHPFACKELSV